MTSFWHGDVERTTGKAKVDFALDPIERAAGVVAKIAYDPHHCFWITAAEATALAAALTAAAGE